MKFRRENARIYFRDLRTWILALILVASVSGPALYAGDVDSLIIRELDGSRYQIDFYKSVDINSDSLVNICFELRHLRQYLARDIILEVLQEEENSHVIRYNLKTMIYQNTTAYRRTRFPERDSITFMQTQFDQNIPVMSSLVKVHGYYKIIPDGGKSLLHYHQMTQVNRRALSEFFILKHYLEAYSMKKFMKAYFNSLMRYVESINEQASPDQATY